MRPLGRLRSRVALPVTRRGLARVAVVVSVLLLPSQVVFAWYVVDIGLSLGGVSYGDDDRTVVIDREDLAAFPRHYHPDHEEGWCLYGSVDRTAIRVTDVVSASALSKRSDGIAFTCVPETARQLVSGRNARLIGVVHSHPSRSRSYLSRVDVMTWGRLSPVVEVMGVYTADDGVEFFTTRSLARPLETRVR